MIHALYSDAVGAQPVINYIDAADAAAAIAASPVPDVLAIATGWSSGDPNYYMAWEVAGGVLQPAVDELRRRVRQKINAHRDARLDASETETLGYTFGLDATTREEWTQLAVFHLFGLLSYPYPATDIDGGDVPVVDYTTLRQIIGRIGSDTITERNLAKASVTAVLATSTTADAEAAAAPYLALPVG